MLGLLATNPGSSRVQSPRLPHLLDIPLLRTVYINIQSSLATPLELILLLHFDQLYIHHIFIPPIRIISFRPPLSSQLLNYHFSYLFIYFFWSWVSDPHQPRQRRPENMATGSGAAPPPRRTWRSVFSTTTSDEESTAEKMAPPKWSMGVLNDKTTIEVPGTRLLSCFLLAHDSAAGSTRSFGCHCLWERRASWSHC